MTIRQSFLFDEQSARQTESKTPKADAPPGIGDCFQSDVSLGLLDQLHFGVICVNEDLKAIYVNEAARALVQQNDGLHLYRGKLSASSGHQTAELQTLVKKMLERMRLGVRVDRHNLKISRPSIRRPLEIMVTVPPARALNPPETAFLSILVFDPEEEINPDVDIVGQVYGLTAAEARVAVMLMQGKSLQETSVILQRTKETVRKQLQSIFEKTHTNRQSELLRLLMRGPASLR